MLAKDIPKDIQDCLMAILKETEDEDMYIRQRMLREAKQLELYWHGFQYIFWDERVQDFRIPTHDVMEQVSSREETKYIYDYVVNIFKAHGLSIIAAVTADVPGVPFTPCDPSNIKDVLAAQRAEALGKVIMKHNKSKLLFYHALFTLYTNHFLCSYTYYERDGKYGTTEVPKYKSETTPGKTHYDCPDCEFSTEVKTDTNECPHCAGPLTTNKDEDTSEQVQDGTDEVEKGRQRIRIRGTLNVKIPTFAADQEGCGYLIDYYDQHFAQLRETYPELYEQITEDATDNFERIARMPSIGRLYSDTYLSKLQTLKRVWFRPSMFNTRNKDESDKLHKMFPDGVYFACINENLFCEAEEACLDDSWTIAKGDLSRAVHGDPLGKPLMPLQDLENIVFNLLSESLEHSVPSTFADPEIIDFETYSKQEVSPGAIYQTKNTLTNPNRQLQDYFYTLKTSTLPKEGVDFDAIIETKGQFLVGAFPSIFGGPQESGKTLGEYQQSRNYALQRLSIPYQMLFFWWADTIYKSVKCYISNMVNDEIHTLKASDGRYITVQLLTADFQSGRFEDITPEAATDLPVSFSQKKSSVEQLVQLNSDVINQFLFSPENRMTTVKFLGIEEYSDLDSNQAVKQLCEIQDMLSGTQVPIEPTIDDDEIHLRIIRNFLSDSYGQELKKDNPTAYETIMQHGEQHYNNLQQKMMMQQQREANQQLLKNTKVKAGPTSVQNVQDQIQKQTSPPPQQPNSQPTNGSVQ